RRPAEPALQNLAQQVLQLPGHLGVELPRRSALRGRLRLPAGGGLLRRLRLRRRAAGQNGAQQVLQAHAASRRLLRGPAGGLWGGRGIALLRPATARRLLRRGAAAGGGGVLSTELVEHVAEDVGVGRLAAPRPRRTAAEKDVENAPCVEHGGSSVRKHASSPFV